MMREENSVVKKQLVVESPARVPMGRYGGGGGTWGHWSTTSTHTEQEHRAQFAPHLRHFSPICHTMAAGSRVLLCTLVIFALMFWVFLVQVTHTVTQTEEWKFRAVFDNLFEEPQEQERQEPKSIFDQLAAESSAAPPLLRLAPPPPPAPKPPAPKPRPPKAKRLVRTNKAAYGRGYKVALNTPIDSGATLLGWRENRLMVRPAGGTGKQVKLYAAEPGTIRNVERQFADLARTIVGQFLSVGGPAVRAAVQQALS